MQLFRAGRTLAESALGHCAAHARIVDTAPGDPELNVREAAQMRTRRFGAT